MIRNVVLGRLRDGSDDDARAAVAAAVAGIVALDLPGLHDATGGFDEGLRDGGWDFAIVNDFDDAEAYHHYDGEAEHNRHRAAIVERCADIARVQFDLS